METYHAEKQQIPLVVLLDDNESTNFIHRKYLQKSGLVERIEVYARPTDLLKTLLEGGIDPSILLIDMNMIEMNAFDFLKHFMVQGLWTKYPSLQIYLLSIALSPEEEGIATNHPMLKRVLLKPLTPNTIKNIHQDYWLSEMADII